MKKKSDSFVLSRESIDSISLEIFDFLKDHKIDRLISYRVRLVIEDLLLSYASF